MFDDSSDAESVSKDKENNDELFKPITSLKSKPKADKKPPAEKKPRAPKKKTEKKGRFLYCLSSCVKPTLGGLV